MMNAATVAEKRPVCKVFTSELARSRRYERTHEEEDAIHVTFPTLHQHLVILLTLLEDDSPELRRRIHVLDLCESHVRNRLRKERIYEVPESFSAGSSWGSRDVSRSKQ